MLPDRVSNPGPLTYESGALPIALRIGLGDSWRWEHLISSQQVIDLSTAFNINTQTQGAKVIGPYPYLQ